MVRINCGCCGGDFEDFDAFEGHDCPKSDPDDGGPGAPALVADGGYSVEEFRSRSAFQQLAVEASIQLYYEGGLTSCYGKRIQAALEELTAEDVNRGRLYPNLNKLVAAGYLEKEAIDDRANAYYPTDAALHVLKAESSRLKDLTETVEVREQAPPDAGGLLAPDGGTNGGGA